MKHISLDNGRTYMTAHAAIGQILSDNLWDTVAQYMDDDTREEGHAYYAPCTEEEFLTEYLRRAPEDLVIG